MKTAAARSSKMLVSYRNTTRRHNRENLHLNSVIIRGCNQKVPDWVDNEICAYLWYSSLRSNMEGYSGKTHYTGSQSSDTTASNGREIYHLQFSLQASSPETFGYTLLLRMTKRISVHKNAYKSYQYSSAEYTVPSYSLQKSMWMTEKQDFLERGAMNHSLSLQHWYHF
jgi:hypothetical protein